MRSSTFPLPRDLKTRRLVVVAVFLGILYWFRHLAPVFICFVVFERTLGWAADQIDRRTPLKRKWAVAALLTTLCGAAGGLAFLLVRRALPLVHTLRADGVGYLWQLAEHPAIVQLRAQTGIEMDAVLAVVKGHAGTAVRYATGTAHVLLFVVIGFILAVIYLFERDDMDTWYDSLPAASVVGTLARWLGYVADAIAVTVRMQVIVAVVNAVLTLPVLLFLGLPHVSLLFLLILVTGLLPVVGNLISGAVLSYVAYTEAGTWAVAVFLGVTFVLHKIESYYLNPRLAAEHVKLPGLVLVISLLLFEQTFGFVGLFLSFPALYVASRVSNEWQVQDATASLSRSQADAIAASRTGAVPLEDPEPEAG